MKVSFEQEGGITGATLKSFVDTNSISTDDAKILNDATKQF